MFLLLISYQIINIRLMELYTTNLLSFSIQQNRLQSNFELINTVLRQLQQQVTILSNQHEGILQSILQNKHQIQNIGNKTQKHNLLLQQHKNWIEQLNSQFVGFDQPNIFIDQDSSHDISKLESRDSRRKAIDEPKNKKSEERLKTEQSVQKQTVKSNEKSGVFQEMIINMKERIKALEKDSLEKNEKIQEMKRILSLKKNRNSQNQQRRASIFSKEFNAKNINSRNEIKQSSMMIESKEYQQEEKSEKGHSNKDIGAPSVLKSDEQFLFIGGDEDFKMEQKVFKLFKDLDKIKEAFAQRNRILDAHMKDNQQKMQNIEKSMDILERSHDMLKYDFDRTNTSFSKTRPGQTHQEKARRAQQRLKDTRITNKQYYEQKLIELFNEMDFLKGEYFEIHNKLEKQIENDPQDQKNQRKIKFAHKVVNNQRQNDESMRRQVMMHRIQLKKLRQQFEQFTFGINTGTNQVKTILIKPNQNKEDWKSLSTKMQKLKTDVQSGIRQLQGKIVANNDMIVGLNQLQVGIEQCKLLINKRIQIPDFQKAMKRLQSRLNNFIIQVYQKQGQQNEFDAALAKQPWFCLSCDSQLKNYTGKVQKPNNNSQKLVGRKVNPELHMVRRNDNGRLPSVLK